MVRSSSPLVSVCIPTYDRPAELKLVVQDILAQTYPRIEVVVTDDGNAEATRRHLAPVLDRVRYHPNDRRLGIYGNWNRSIELASGELVAVYHDHDRYLPTIVERSVDLFLRSDRVGLVHVATEATYPDSGQTIRPTYSDLPDICDGRWFAQKQAMLWSSYVAHGCMMVRAELYRRLGSFDESKGIAADMDMLIRFALQCDIGFVREYLYLYAGRKQGDALHGFRWSDLEEYIQVRRLNVDRAFGTQGRTPPRWRRALQRQIDYHLVKTMLWLDLHGRRDDRRVGWDVLSRHASRPAVLAARLLLSPAAPAEAGRSLSYWAWRQLRPFRGASRFR